MLAVGAVLFVIFWRGPGRIVSSEQQPSERVLKPARPPEDPQSKHSPNSRPERPDARAEGGEVPPAGPAPAPPDNLVGLLERYLDGRRLRVATATQEADLNCLVPAGRSLFQVHADLATAARYWKAGIVSGEERRIDPKCRALDLRIERGGESIRLRFLQQEDEPAERRIAIVIDDFGFQDVSLMQRFLDLPIPITPAILPGYAHSSAAARLAAERERCAILHLPMEPREYPDQDPGPGALMTSMARFELQAVLGEDLGELPGMAGVSNHMGSRASEDTALVGAVLDQLRAKGLFFLDSATAPHSAFPAEAARRGVPWLAADLFLDGETHPTPATMRKHLLEARDLASRTGSAVLIGHARPATLAFLSAAPESLRAWGCRPVPLTDLLR